MAHMRIMQLHNAFSRQIIADSMLVKDAVPDGRLMSIDLHANPSLQAALRTKRPAGLVAPDNFTFLDTAYAAFEACVDYALVRTESHQNFISPCVQQ